jgi:hypothetical protein
MFRKYGTCPSFSAILCPLVPLALPGLKFNEHSFGGCKTFDRTVCQADSLPAEFNLPAQVVVATVRIVMEEAKGFDTRFNGYICGVDKCGVTPASSEFVFLVRILGIMEQ